MPEPKKPLPLKLLPKLKPLLSQILSLLLPILSLMLPKKPLRNNSRA